MCHYRHHAHDDPFWLPGLNDITAHVDFSAIAQAGEAAGLDLLGYDSQAGFLLRDGLLDLLGELEPGSAEYYRQAAAVQRLLSPSEMGELFKAVLMGRGLGEGIATNWAGDRRGRL
jgi:SAM-dependent MidA family methyltransferase